jgi:hypothetical protein
MKTNTQPLSANTLFHFTSSMKNLLGILANGFQPNYCIENYEAQGYEVEIQAIIPMVCFCDIPLSKIHNHASHYGGYALGMSKSWGMKNKITPVLYSYKYSALESYLYFISKDMSKDIEFFLDKYSLLLKSYFNIMRFVKPYEGRRWKQGQNGTEIIRFYDEREWRFVPEDKPEGSAPSLAIEEWKQLPKYAKEVTTAVRKRKLGFTAKDIRYIVVKEDREVKLLVKKLSILKGQNFANAVVPRIITIQQIHDDF